MKKRSICAVEGVTASGIKEGKFGLALIRASGTAAGVFTENLVKAAPIQLMRTQIRKGKLDAVVVNSGCANAYTGQKGYEDAVVMTEYASSALGLSRNILAWRAPALSAGTWIFPSSGSSVSPLRRNSTPPGMPRPSRPTRS